MSEWLPFHQLGRGPCFESRAERLGLNQTGNALLVELNPLSRRLWADCFLVSAWRAVAAMPLQCA